jgi:hypothetical protein
MQFVSVALTCALMLSTLLFMRTQRSAPGRPRKYGRPARLVSLTLPEDVLEWLTAIHLDPAWAIVKLYESVNKRSKVQPTVRPAAELVQLPNKRALIVVKPEYFQGVEGVSLIPLSDGRALLALPEGRGIADLELALVDRLGEDGLSHDRRRELEQLRGKLREWRHTTGLTFRSQSIIVADRSPRNGHPSVIAHPKTGGRRSRLNSL